MIAIAHKKAFSMLTAIVVIVTMSVIAMYVTSTAGKSIKTTTDQYRNEQAALYAKSYTEYAIMAVGANAARMLAPADPTNGCLNTISATIGEDISTNSGRGRGYQVRVQIAYIGNGAAFGTSGYSGIANCAGLRQLATNVADANTPLSLIIDTYVDYNDLNDNRLDDAASNGAGNGEIRHFTYHRRSLQKI